MNKFINTLIYFVIGLITINRANAQSTSLIGFDSVVVHKFERSKVTDFSYAINVTYAQAISGNTAIQNFINEFITQNIITHFGYDSDNYDRTVTVHSTSVNDALNLLLKKELYWVDNHAEIGDWWNTIKVTITFQNENYITLFISVKGNTGGAHGWHGYYYYTLDLKKLHEMSIADVSTDTLKLNSIAENLFKKINNIPASESLITGNDYSFIPSFYVSHNFGIVNDTLKAIYNEYEIASYAEGAIYFSLPLSTIADILKEPFKHEVQQEK